jgi:UDP-glucose:(heptosyl)LPS alpha-1,3-glucosyltransferase
MKIALAIENFSRYGGGAESYSVELASSLVKKSWEVHLYGYSWDGHPTEAFFHQISRPPKWYPPFLRILDFALRHKKMVNEQRFDVILGFGNTIEMDVYQSHGGVHSLSSTRKLKAVDNPFFRAMKRFAMLATPKYHVRAWIESAPFRKRQLPVVVAISDMVRDDMAEYFTVSKEKIELVYNGINGSRFYNQASQVRRDVRSKLGFGEEILFLFMAYDFRKKGVKQLLQSAGTLMKRRGTKSFGIVIAGGEPSKSLTRSCNSMGISDVVVFPGATKTPELYYSACDVFILPTFYDACSLVIIEALTAGLPSITTRWNGASGIITSGLDGIVLDDPRNSMAMADAMEHFLNAENLNRARVAAAITGRKYTLEANHAEMMRIFESVARSKSRTH